MVDARVTELLTSPHQHPTTPHQLATAILSLVEGVKSALHLKSLTGPTNAMQETTC